MTDEKPAKKADPKPGFKLVVRDAFAGRQRGDEITAADEIQAVLDSHPGHVVKVAL